MKKILFSILPLVTILCFTCCSNSNSYSNGNQNNNVDYPETSDYGNTYEEKTPDNAFYNQAMVWGYLKRTSFYADGITVRYSDGSGFTANGKSLGRTPQLVEFNEQEALLRFSTHSGSYTTIYVDCVNGILQTGSGEIFYAR